MYYSYSCLACLVLDFSAISEFLMLTVLIPGAAILEYTILQTQNMAPYPASVYRHRADLSLCYALMCVVITTFLSWKFSTMRILCGHALSSWKMKPGSTAAIPKGITTGYNEIVTRMYSETLWPPQLLISFLSFFFRTPLTV